MKDGYFDFLIKNSNNEKISQEVLGKAIKEYDKKCKVYKRNIVMFNDITERVGKWKSIEVKENNNFSINLIVNEKYKNVANKLNFHIFGQIKKMSTDIKTKEKIIEDFDLFSIVAYLGGNNG